MREILHHLRTYDWSARIVQCSPKEFIANIHGERLWTHLRGATSASLLSSCCPVVLPPTTTARPSRVKWSMLVLPHS